MSDSATAAASGAEDSAPRAKRPTSSRDKAGRPSPVARISLFVRQVIAELKKVVWPTRSELVTYTGVVLAFVAMVMAFVTAVDFGIGQATFAVFGG